MSLSIDDFARIEGRILPELRLVLREARAHGAADPVATVKAMQDTGASADRVVLETRLGLTLYWLGADDFGQMVAHAALAL